MKTSDALEIEVTNFGPIVEANVELRPFTLFVGPSNTGKSYLAVMIYVLHRMFSGSMAIDDPRRHREFKRYPPHFWNPLEKGKLPFSDSDIKFLLDWAQKTFTETEVKGTTGEYPTLPEEVAALMHPLLSTTNDTDGVTGAEIVRYFGIQSLVQLVRMPGASGAQVVLRRYDGTARDDESPFVYKLNISKSGKPCTSSSIPIAKPLYYEGHTLEQLRLEFRRLMATQNQADRQHLAFLLINELVDAVFPHVVGPAGVPAHYLPAGRAGIMQVEKLGVAALYDNRRSRGRMLSGILADFLNQLSLLSDISPDGRQHRVGFAAELEKTLLGGTVQHEKRTRRELPPSLVYRPDGWKKDLPLMCTSSMVAELAPVVLYLRHVVGKGDVLIIEEPESHLHPEMQVEFTRLLASAVRAGIRIIMTTHSEWVLEELANLVQASELSESERETINGSDIALREDEVGAWLFQPKKRPKGSVVQEIPLNRDSGTFAAGYDKVAVDVYNRWAELSSQANKREGK